MSGEERIHVQSEIMIEGDLQTIFRFSYLKVYKLITLETKFMNL